MSVTGLSRVALLRWRLLCRDGGARRADARVPAGGHQRRRRIDRRDRVERPGHPRQARAWTHRRARRRQRPHHLPNTIPAPCVPTISRAGRPTARRSPSSAPTRRRAPPPCGWRAAARSSPPPRVKGVANTARWSPDGASIALLATVGAKKQTGAVEAGARQVGEIGVEEDAQRIALAPAAGGVLRLVSPPDSYVYEYDWMPDGRGFVATSAKGNGDNNWWVATPRPRRRAQRRAAHHRRAEAANEPAARLARWPQRGLRRRPDERLRLGRRRRVHGAVRRRRAGRRHAGVCRLLQRPGLEGQRLAGVQPAGQRDGGGRDRPGGENRAHAVERGGDGERLERRAHRLQQRRQFGGLGPRNLRTGAAHRRRTPAAAGPDHARQ